MTPRVYVLRDEPRTRPMVRASMRSTSSAHVLVQSWGQTEGTISAAIAGGRVIGEGVIPRGYHSPWVSSRVGCPHGCPRPLAEDEGTRSSASGLTGPRASATRERASQPRARCEDASPDASE